MVHFVELQTATSLGLLFKFILLWWQVGN